MLRASLAVKVATVAFATVCFGGIAVAASTPLHDALGAGSSASNGPSSRPTPDAKKGAAQASREAASTPSPSLVGLCRAYLAGVADNPGKALDNPAFTALITAAGGEDKVAAYCAHAAAAKGKSAATVRPTGQPTALRTGQPTAAPTGKPTEEPAGKPTDLRTGKPTAPPVAKSTAPPTGKPTP